MITAFLDESGTHGSSARSTILAGYWATPEQWTRIEEDWIALCAIHRLESFHAKDFSRWGRPGSDRCEDDRDPFAHGAIDVLLRNGIRGIVAGLYNADYLRYRKEFQRKIGRIDSAYGMCFRSLMSYLGGILRDDHPGESISFVLEEGHRNTDDARRIFFATKRSWHSYLYPLGTFDIKPNNTCAGLQMADFLAHETYGFVERKMQGALAEGSKNYYRALMAVPTEVLWNSWDHMKTIGEGATLIKQQYKKYGGRPPGLMFQKRKLPTALAKLVVLDIARAAYERREKQDGEGPG